MTREEALRIVFEQLGYNEGLMEALEQPAQHKWSAYGERRVKCGDKDCISKEQK